MKTMASVSLVLVLLTLVNVEVEAHVALTFPPARNFDLDFLDSARTRGPCGMPKGKVKRYTTDPNNTISTVDQRLKQAP